MKKKKTTLPKPKNISIVVYLTPTDKKELHEKMQKYHVSESTLTSVVMNWCISAGLTETLNKEYIYKNENVSQGTIKPRCIYTKEQLKQPNMFATNCLKLYLRKQFKQYTALEQKTIEKMLNGIAKDLQKTLDIFWDHNNQIRSMARAIRQNKEYYKKILED